MVLKMKFSFNEELRYSLVPSCFIQDIKYTEKWGISNVINIIVIGCTFGIN